MKGRAILHIGPMKTGSTSIQRWLGRNAVVHAENGFFVPIASGTNLSNLATAARAAARRHEVPAVIAAWRDRLLESIAARPAHCPAVVLSGEMLGQGLRSRADFRALRALLDPLFDEYQVVAYLRRQDEVALSRFSTGLRHGERSRNPLKVTADHEAMLAAWAKAFGRAAMSVRLFQRDTLIEGDVVRDFAATTGMPWVATPGAAEMNRSLKPPAQWLLAEIARRLERQGYKGAFGDLPAMDRLRGALNHNFAGRGALPPRAEVIAFYETFREANERVRRAWFPERTTLFDEDFSDLPEVGTPDPTAEEKLDAALVALVAALLAREREPDGRRSAARSTRTRERKIGRKRRKRRKD